MTSLNFRKQLPANLISNVAYFVLNVLIGIWLVPYFIRQLGTEGYGFIPLAVAVTSYASLITMSLNNAVSRYLVIDLQRKDILNAKKTFNTAFWTQVFLSFVLLLLSCVFAFFMPQIFNVPEDLVRNVQWFFLIVLVSFIISVFSAVFSVSTVVYNRLDLRNVINIGNLFFRTLFIVILFTVLSANLIFVGIAYLIGALFALLSAHYFFRRLTPELKISRNDFERSRLNALVGMGGWLVINQIGALLFLQIDLIVVNILLGPQHAGQYGAILQWNFLLRSLAGMISGVLTPMVLISHARDERDRIIFMSQKAVKFFGLGMAIPIGILCGFSRPLLTVWLGEGFSQFAPLLCLLTFHLVVNLAVLPLFAINTALNRVKVPGLVTFFMGVVNLMVAVVFVKVAGWGMYGVAAAGAIVLTLKNTIFTPVYAAYILKIPYDTFIRPMGLGVLLALIGMGIGFVLSRAVLIEGWPALIAIGGAVFLAVSLLAFVLLGKERALLLSLMKVR